MSKYDWEIIILTPQDYERASELLEAERAQHRRMIQNHRPEASVNEIERHILYLEKLTEGWNRQFQTERAELLELLEDGV